MRLRELFTKECVKLDLESETKEDTLRELVALLELDERSEGILYKTLKRRENLGSTGIGKGIAIPHCRSLVVNRLRLAYGRKLSGLDFNAIKVPVFLWHGAEDNLVPVSTGRGLAQLIPGCEAHYVPDAGHILLGSEEVASQMMGRIAGLPA